MGGLGKFQSFGFRVSEAIYTILDVKIESEFMDLPPEFFIERIDKNDEIGKDLSVDDDLFEQEIDAWVKRKVEGI